MSNPGRKFWAFVISLVAIVVCAIFHLDVAVGVSTLFAVYCTGNCAAKYANKNKEENKND